MTEDSATSVVVDAVLKLANDSPYTEISEENLITLLSQSTDRTRALEIWEIVAPRLRHSFVKHHRVLQWNFFRRVITVTRALTVEEIDRFASASELAIPYTIGEQLRSLSGLAFERFMADFLNRLPQFKDVSVTKASRDDGVDFKGFYQPEVDGPRWRLIGQAKQWGVAISSSMAREFVGALSTSGERHIVGLYVSMNGYSAPAINTFKRSDHTIRTWELSDIQKFALKHEVGTKSFEATLPILDQTYWNEIGAD